MPYRPCLDCGAVTTATRCPTCASRRGRARDAARGSRQARGYDAEHDALRARWAPFVEAGLVDCARCGRPIAAGSAWDLGHDDHDRTVHRGPEHAVCNRGRRPGRRQRPQF